MVSAVMERGFFGGWVGDFEGADQEIQAAGGNQLLAHRFGALEIGIDGQPNGDQRDAERAGGDGQQLALAAGGIALRQLIKLQPGDAGDQLEQREPPAILAVAQIGRNGFGRYIRQAAIFGQTEAQRGRETFAIIAGIRLAADDQRQHPGFAMGALEGENFLVHPDGLRRTRAAQHDLETGSGQRRAQFAAQIGTGRQFIAVAEHRWQPRRHRAERRCLADQPARQGKGFQRLVQPARHRGIGVAVTDEGAEAFGHRDQPGLSLTCCSRSSKNRSRLFSTIILNS